MLSSLRITIYLVAGSKVDVRNYGAFVVAPDGNRAWIDSRVMRKRWIPPRTRLPQIVPKRALSKPERIARDYPGAKRACPYLGGCTSKACTKTVCQLERQHAKHEGVL